MALGVAFATATPAVGQDPTVRAYLSANPVRPGSTFDLNVEITGAQRLDSDPELPELDFASFLSNGRTSSVQIVNGVTSVSTVLVYRYRADREGTFEIGPVRVQAEGRTLTTEPLSLTVGRGSAVTRTPSPPAASGDPPRPDADLGPDDIFITTDVSDTRVYTGEPVIVEYRIWTRVNVSQYSVTELPANTGFWVEEFPLPSPEVEQVERNGIPFATAVIRKVALFPTGPGSRTVQPLALEAQVRVRRRSNDLLDDFFSRSLLGRMESVPVESPPVEIQVLPLPAGAPRSFNGFVGKLDVTASVDRPSVETDEALSLVVRVEAEGNVNTVPPPDVAFPAEFEVYPPEVSERIDRSGDRVRGSKTYQYVLIPRAPGSLTIPSIEMGYFDPATERYTAATAPPLTVEVTGDPTGGPLGANRSRGSIEPLREDIRFIAIEVPTFYKTGRTLPASPAFWLLLFVPLVAVGSAVGVRRHKDRLSGDVAYARARRATRQARKRLNHARSLTHGDGRTFYAEVSRALRGFLGDRLNLSEAGLMTDEVRTGLQHRGASEDAVDAFLSCLDECDRQRFSPSETGVDDRRAFLERAAEVMSGLDRELQR